MNRRWARLAAIGVVAVGYVTGVATADAYRPNQSIVVRDAHGHRLPTEPQLHPGLRLRIEVSGFAAHVPVRGHVASTVVPSLYAWTDRRGEATFDWTVPRTLPVGRHLFSFTAAAAHPQMPKRSERRDLLATLPRLVNLRFRVDGHGGRDVGGLAFTQDPGRSGGLASTGLNVVGLAAAGLAAILGGAVLLTRRRSLRQR